MATSATEAIAAFRRAHDEAERLVEGLDSDGLVAQSGAAEWTVAQVLSHLGSSSELALRTVKAGYDDPEAAPAVWARWDAMSPAEMAANFVTSERQLVEEVESLNDDDLATRTIKLAFMPMPVDVGFFVEMRLSEVALHRWDVDVAFDAGAEVLPFLVPILLDRLPLFAGFFAKPIGTSGSVAIETSRPDRSYLLEFEEGGATLSQLESPAPDTGTRLRLPAEAFLRLTAGRLRPDHTPAGVDVGGELTLEDLRRMFPGF